MGNLMYTNSNDVASFKSASIVPIESLKHRFLPIQEGSGNPSSENVRPINGSNSITICSGIKNLVHIVGYGVYTTKYPGYPRSAGPNSYGTSISTINFTPPDTSLVITQEVQSTDYTAGSIYKNGYFEVETDNLKFSHTYMISFRITNIITNPLNKTFSDIRLGNPYGNRMAPKIIDGDKLIFEYENRQNASNPHSQCITIYNVGMSFTISELMITELNEDYTWVPYDGKMDTITFPIIGKNKFDPIYKNLDNYTVLGPYSYKYTDSIQLIPNTVYTIKPNSNGNIESESVAYWIVRVFTTNDTSITTSTAGSSDIFYILNGAYNNSYGQSYTFTTGPSGIISFGYLDSGGSKAIVNSFMSTVDIQLELGSAATTYESYSSNNTVYGGYVDIIAGEVVEEWASVDLGDLTWKAKDTTGDYNYFYSTDIQSKIDIVFLRKNYRAGTAWYISSIKPYLSVDYSATEMGKYCTENNVIIITTSGAKGRIVVRNDDLTDPTEFKELVTGVQLVYKLLTPIHHPISKSQLNTRLNRNSFWSTSNDITEVSYYIHDSYMIQEAKKRAMAEHKMHYRKVMWNQWSQPLTADNWQAYSTRSTVSFENGIATNEWLEAYTGYVTSIRDKVGTRQSDGEIWYASYMVKTSESDVQWGIEMCGGRQIRGIVKTTPNEWAQCSAVATYYRGTNNFLYICNISSSSSIGLTAQVKSPILINLTAMFGKGREPTKKHFEYLCKMNGIDLTEYHAKDTGTLQYWWTPESGTDDQTILEWNQYCKPLISDNWQIYNTDYATVTFNNNIATRTDIQEITNMNQVYQNVVKTSYQITLNSTHLYYTKQEIYSSTPCNCVLVLGQKWAKTQAVEANTWTTVETIATPTISGTSNFPYYLMYTNNLSEIDNTCSGKDPILIDLTQMFGEGNEPSTIQELKATCLKNGYNLDEAQKYNLGTKMIWKV